MGIISRYNYIQLTNLNNMLSQIGDSALLGYMDRNEEIDITVKALKPSVN